MTDSVVKVLRKFEFNNFIVGHRGVVRQAINHTINKLTRDASKLRSKKTNDEQQKEKNNRRANKYIEEIKFIKSLHSDDIAKFAALKTKSYKEVGDNPNSSVSERALCMVSEHKSLQSVVKKFRDEYPNWFSEAPDIIKGLGVNYRKKRLKTLAAKGKLEPIIEKERKFFLLLHELVGLELNPKMLKAAKGPVSLNKNKKVDEIKKGKLLNHNRDNVSLMKTVAAKNTESKNVMESDVNLEEHQGISENAESDIDLEESENAVHELGESSDTAYESDDIASVVTDSEGEESEENSEKIMGRVASDEKVGIVNKKIENDDNSSTVKVRETMLIKEDESDHVNDEVDCTEKQINKNTSYSSRTILPKEKKVSDSLKLKSKKTCKNQSVFSPRSDIINQVFPLEEVNSIFPSFVESSHTSKKSSIINILSNNNIPDKKHVIKSFIKGTCEVKQIDLENVSEDLLQNKDEFKTLKNLENDSSDDDCCGTMTPNAEGNKTSFFLGREAEDVSSHDENDIYDDGVTDYDSRKKISHLKNFNKNESVKLLNEKKHEKFSSGHQKLHNDGLNRYERRRQQFGPVEHQRKKRINIAREDWSSEGPVLKRQRGDFKNQYSGHERQRARGDRGGFKESNVTYSRKDMTFSFQKNNITSSTNYLPLSSQKPASGNTQSKESLLHPSWAAKKKEAEQSSAINAFQGKKIKFDD